MASSDRLSTASLRALISRTTVAFAVTALIITGCQQVDCIAGDSVVELRVPSSSWVVDRFCVDDECLSASERQPAPDGPEVGPAVFYSYVIDVSDRPDAYRYRVELTGPDGARHIHDGVVETKGNLMGGENCRPTSAIAALIVDENGQLTTQSP